MKKKIKYSEIQKKIIIIFENEIINITLGYKLKTGAGILPQLENKIIKDTKNIELNSENINLLKILFSKIENEEQKKKFTNFILKINKINVEFLTLKHFIFQFLIHIGEIEQGIRYLIRNINITWMSVKLFKELSNVLKFEHYLLDDKILNKLKADLNNIIISNENIKSAISNSEKLRNLSIYDLNSPQIKKIQTNYTIAKKIMSLYEYLNEQIKLIQHLMLHKELKENINFEINQDKDKILQKLKYLNFPDQLIEIIEKIEKKFYESNNVFHFKECMTHIRSFSEELNKIIVKRIENKSGIKLQGDYEKPSNIRNYFRKQDIDFLNKDEINLIEKIYSFISNQGVHPLTSKREYARISKNIVIELSLLMLDRLKNIFNGEK